MFIGDYHTHTRYSDGKGCVMQNALAAKERGLKEIAVTDHAFLFLKKDEDKRRRFFEECREAEAATGVKVIPGTEADILSLEGDLDLPEEEMQKAGYLIAGFHKFAFPKDLRTFFKMYFVTYFNGIIPTSEKAKERNTLAVIRAITRYPVKVLTHLNHSLKVNVGEVANACAEKGVLVEINVKHLRDFKGVWGELAASGASFVLCSDAHRPSEVGALQKGFEEAVKQGIDPKRIVNYTAEQE